MRAHLVKPLKPSFCAFIHKTHLVLLSLLTAQTSLVQVFLPLLFQRVHQDEISNKSQLMHSQMNSQNTQRELFHLIPCIVSISFFVLQTQNTDLSSHKTLYTMPETPGDIGSSTA